MQIIKQIEGNVIEMFKQGNTGIIIHNCDSVKKLDSSISKEFKENFPEIEEVDNEFPLPSLYRLGDYSVVPTEYGTILNFYTELVPGNFEFTALKSCLKKLSMEAIRSGSYIEVLYPVDEHLSNDSTIKKILNFQENLLITIAKHDKGQISMGKEEANSAS